MVYLCQKIWKLADSRQKLLQKLSGLLFWPTLYIIDKILHVVDSDIA